MFVTHNDTFPCSRAMRRHNSTISKERFTQYYHGIGWALLHGVGVVLFFFLLMRINRSGWLWVCPAQRFCVPGWVCTLPAPERAPGKADPWEWIPALQLWQIWAQSREWIPAWPGISGKQQAQGTRIKELLSCCLCTGVDTERISNHSWWEIRVWRAERRWGGRGRNQSRISPALPAQHWLQQGLCSVFTLFHPSLDYQTWHSPHRAGWASRDHFFLTIMMVKDLQELLCPPPALPDQHQHPSGGHKLQMKTLFPS